VAARREPQPGNAETLPRQPLDELRSGSREKLLPDFHPAQLRVETLREVRCAFRIGKVQRDDDLRICE